MVKDAAPPELEFTRAVLDAAVLAVATALDLDACAVLLPSVEPSVLRTAARRNLSEPQAAALVELLREPDVARVMEENRPFVVRDPAGMPRPLHRRLQEEGWPDLLAMPIPGTGTPPGVLVCIAEGDGHWTAERRSAAAALASHLGVSLRAAVRATDAARQPRRADALLARLPMLRQPGLSVEAALAAVTAGVGDALDLSHCLGVLSDVEDSAEYCKPGVRPIGGVQRLTSHPAWALLRMGSVWSYDESEASPADRSATAALLGSVRPKTIQALPIGRIGSVRGALLLIQVDRRRRFRDEETRFAQSAATELDVLFQTATPTASADVAATISPDTVVAVATAGEYQELAEATRRALSESGLQAAFVLWQAKDEGVPRLELVIAQDPRVTLRRLRGAGTGDLLARALDSGESVTGAVSALPEPWQRVTDLPAETPLVALALPSATGTHLAVFAGAGAAISPELRAFAAHLVGRFEALATNSLARTREERLNAMNAVVVAASLAEDLATASRHVAEAIQTHLDDIDSANVWVVDRKAGELRLFSRSGSVEGVRHEPPVQLEGDTGGSRAISTGKTVVVRRDDQDVPVDTRARMERNGWATLCYIPLRHGSRVDGVLSLGSRRQRVFGPEELTFLEALAAQLGRQLERVAALELADAERQRLSSVLAALDTGLVVVIVDANGAVVSSSEFGMQIFEQEQILRTRHLKDIDGLVIAPEDLPISRALHGQVVAGSMVTYQRSDGREIPLLVNARPIRNAAGQITGAVGVFQDISTVVELASLKNDFINTVSHELRTPITTIRGDALMLRRRWLALDEETRTQLLEDIAEEAERLHLLVEDLLSLTRSRSGIRVSPEPVTLHRLVNRVVTEMGGRVGRHTITVEVAPDLPPVDTDPELTTQVLRNLLSNAVKFSPDPLPVEVAAAVSNGEVIVSVLDRGSGVPPEDMVRVFEPFYRAPEAVRSATQGAGLGLAVARRLVEMQGGRIWAERRLGGGAAFRFTLPIAEE